MVDVGSRQGREKVRRMTIGILAFGSLLDDPGPELQARVVRRIASVETPFAVEFARSSRTRDGAPTLVPVHTGGAAVRAAVLVLEDAVDEELARDLLYRRETRQVGESVIYRVLGGGWIPTISPFAGLSACLYTALEPNIRPLTVARLADLALQSAAGAAGAKRRDGISYLGEQKRRGVMTPLMPAYEAEVLARTGGRDLADAWARVRDDRG
jgi:hypothetical protein